MNPFAGRELSMRFIKIGVIFLTPGLIASVANIDFWIFNGMFMVGLALLFAGLFIRIRFWRCPNCHIQLHADSALTNRCHKCGAQLVETEQE